MQNNIQFDKNFTLKLTDRFDTVFVSIFTLVSLFIIINIVIISNLNYNLLNRQADFLIRNRYKSMISELLIKHEAKPPESDLSTVKTTSPKTARGEFITTKISREVERKTITKKIASRGIFKALKKNDAYADLPDLEDYDIGYENDAFVELSRKNGNSRIMRRSSGRATNFDASDFDGPIMKNPFNYLLDRRGDVFIEITDELLTEPEIQNGYRDPNEIDRVIYQYRPMIEHCFKKESRIQSGLRGYVKVQFKISYEGYVIPESIKIINSTIRSKQVEQCIKNYIKRWRNFERLDESMGLAKVVQKFVFN
ncbi:MAG: AgmX/PglI C-terminal domain-containing protein [Calditrichales bacterium]|nr:AgmX/PglI C-terminal domain-containing protein [Calditrichales bacterium]